MYYGLATGLLVVPKFFLPLVAMHPNLTFFSSKTDSVNKEMVEFKFNIFRRRLFFQIYFGQTNLRRK